MNYADIIWKLIEKLLDENSNNSTDSQNIKEKAED